jgi:ABC-2 type transport system permease protein
MKALLLREIKSFWFANRLFGHRAIPDYQRIISLGFEGDYNILNTGFADMSPFFTLAPWILIFLIPNHAQFLHEKKRKLELLLTKPLSFGKCKRKISWCVLLL